jgi:hypothetical protein
VKIKLVDEKHIKKAKKLILANFSNISNNFEIRYKYTHSCGKTSFIDMTEKVCPCAYMFDHGICAHLIRIALIEEVALPGMVAHTRLMTKQREKAKKINEKIVESDQEFEENLNTIEQQASIQLHTEQTQATEQIQANEQIQTPVEFDKLAPKKRGRKKKEAIPNALEKSPENVQKQILRRSQLSKK